MENDKLTNSQNMVLDTLESENAITYEDIAELTGLSYDGVRGRVSELKKMGYKIEKYREGRNTFLKYGQGSSYRRPLELNESINRKIDAIKDFYGITDFLEQIQKHKTKKTKKLNNDVPNINVEHALLSLSDLHFGELIYDIENGNDIVFNSNIAKERIERLTTELIDNLKLNDINHLVIAGIGDIVDGDTIYRNHLFNIDKSAIEQVRDAVTSLSTMIKEIVANNITVEMYNVRGNHGITNYKNLEEDNWDNVVYDMLAQIFSDDESVLIHNFKGSEGKFLIGDRKIVISHGEKFGRQIKTASGLREFRGVCGKHRLEDGDMVLIGHLHEFGVESDQGKLLVRNGSIANTSEYAYKLNMYSEPIQTLLLFNDIDSYPTIIPLHVK